MKFMRLRRLYMEVYEVYEALKAMGYPEIFFIPLGNRA